MRRVLLASVVSLLPFAAAADPLFTIGDAFNIQGNNTPGSVNVSIPFTVGNHDLGNGLNLNINIVADPSTPQSEWVVFTYTEADGVFFGNTGVGWNVDEVGVPAAVALNFIGDAVQWFSGSTVLTQSPGPNGVFSQTLMPNPVPGGPAGQAEGTLGFLDPIINGPGGLPLLGSFMSSANLLDNHGIASAEVTGYSEALQFAPQELIPPEGAPEPSTLAVLAFGLLGTIAAAARKRD